MNNTGTADAGFQIDELNVPPIAAAAAPQGRSSILTCGTGCWRGSRAGASRRRGRPEHPGTTGGAERPCAPAGNVVDAYPSNLETPWGVAFNTDAGDFWVSKARRSPATTWTIAT